ncbi:undecaprenyl-diphosphate phosphatase [Gemmatimonadota bacterium DH-20]|uniref:Undecaprenyl-diphosphatase n=1 Tax=Gaopeijia maritima TaxID=3119007 RepID=A0ABU9E6U2_9BACT
MMSIWEALILGFVQGATEFLPVSSSGHLVVAQELLDVHVEGVLFEVAVHVATLVSIVLVYRERIGGLLAGMLRREREAWEYAGLIVAATIPAAVIGLAFEDRLEALFDDPVVPGVAFLVTGVLLWSSRGALARGPEARPVLRVAILIGLAQALALVPGISRSGSTVVAALWLGVAPIEAAAFSFLMAVPAIAGAAVLQIPDVLAGPIEVSTAALLAGGVAAAVTGVLAIKTFVEMLRRRSFHHFALYLWVVGVAYLAWLALR